MWNESLEASVEATTPREIALFDKCRAFTRAHEVQTAGLYPYFQPISESQGTSVVIDGVKKVMLGSNDYLGLAQHPKVIEAASAALGRYGAGCSGSRFLNGALDLHQVLEARLAALVGKPEALVFSTGYLANVGLIASLVGRDDAVFVDKLDHASIVDGARMSAGRLHRYAHADLDHLGRLLARTDAAGRMVIVDGVFSMEGDIADLPGLTALCRTHNAALAVDDAHAIGVLGPHGAGTAAYHGLTGEVDVIVGTFSKSLASTGGFVAAAEQVIHHLRHHSRQLIFTAGLPPASTAAALAALDVMVAEPERRDRLWANTTRLRDGLTALGFVLSPTRTPIVPVLTGTIEQTFALWRGLFDAGVCTNPVIAPAVPAARCRLRVTAMATHTDDQIDFALDAFARRASGAHWR
jgi:8-amino-7-oxononanoate synthase